MKKSLILAAAASILMPAAALPNEEEDPNVLLEPAPPPLVEFSREGHLDVSAKSRVLTWKATDPTRLQSLEVQIVKVIDGSNKPEVIYRSKERSGKIDLEDLKKGPGLYAILAETKDKQGVASKLGMRFSYAALNPDCPTDKAWWAGRKTVDFQSGNRESKREYHGLSPRNLLSISRHASHVVTGVVSSLVSCPTKEGSLFTYVQFEDVKSLRQEGESKTPRELVLRMPGGIAHGRVENVTDAPIFRSGDQALLFLNRDPQSHMPIVGGASGVYLIENGESVRSYWGPNVIEITEDFTIRLDPGYKLSPKHLRHYDPNMRAVMVDPEPTRGINVTQEKQAVTSEPAISIKEFAKKLDGAWRAADRMGRIPERISFDNRPPYNSVPAQEPRT